MRAVSSAASQDIMRSRGWELMLATFNEDDVPAEQGANVDTNAFKADLQKTGAKAMDLYQGSSRLVSSLQVLKRAVTITAVGGRVWGGILHLISRYGPALFRMVYNGIAALQSEEEKAQKRQFRKRSLPKPKESEQAQELSKQIWTMVAATEAATMHVHQTMHSNIFLKRKRGATAREGLILLRDVIDAKLAAIGNLSALYQASTAAELALPSPKACSNLRGAFAHTPGKMGCLGEVSSALRVLKHRLAEVGSTALLVHRSPGPALHSCQAQWYHGQVMPPHVHGFRHSHTESRSFTMRENRRWARLVANAEVQRAKPQGQKLEVTFSEPREVSCVSVSPNGAFLATGTKNRTIAVWSMATGQLIHEMEGGGEWIVAIAWCPDSNMVAIATLDTTAVVLNAATGQPVYELHGNDDVEVQDFIEDVSWSPNGALIATASWDETAAIWDAATGAWKMCLQGHTDQVCTVQWSPDSSKLASGSKDRTCIVWCSESGSILATLEGHSGKVSSISWSPDGGRLATASWDSTAIVWNVATGAQQCVFRGHSRLLTSIAWSPDHHTLATASYDKTVALWDLKSDKTGQPVLARVIGEHHGPVNAVCWSVDGRNLVSASDDGFARIVRVCARCVERSSSACPRLLQE